jgi:hypothetical protein
MFCPKCGTQNSEAAGFCTSCGASLKSTSSSTGGNAFGTPPPPPPSGGGPNNDPGADTILKVVAFCFPIVGLVLYFVWKNEKPKSANDVCKFAAIGFGVGIVLYIIMMAFGMMAGAMGGGY